MLCIARQSMFLTSHAGDVGIDETIAMDLRYATLFFSCPPPWEGGPSQIVQIADRHAGGHALCSQETSCSRFPSLFCCRSSPTASSQRATWAALGTMTPSRLTYVGDPLAACCCRRSDLLMLFPSLV